MSEQEFELYLKLLSRCLKLTAAQRDQIADELRDHLEQRLEELARAGVPREKAVFQALDEFGDAAVLAGEFATIARLKRRRFLMRLSFGSVAALAVAILIAFAFWPGNRAVHGPALVVAQEKAKPAGRGAAKPGSGGSTSKVEVARAFSREVVDQYVAPGTTSPFRFVQIRALVTGYLDKVFFQPGQSVKQGDLLFQVDPRLYQAEVDKANATVAEAQARLASARVKYERLQHVFQQKAIEERFVEECRQERDAAEAKVRLATPDVEIAKLKLSYTKITAPISGRINRSLLDAGNLIKADETILASIVADDPIYVDFSLDERTFFRLRSNLLQGQAKGPAVPVTISLDNGSQCSGKLDWWSNQVDPASRTIPMRAVVPNSDGAMLPGMFGVVRLPISKPYKGLAVPKKAVGEDVKGEPHVLVVNERNVLELRPVTLGPEEKGSVVIRTGLTESDWFVVSGVKDLHPGMTVQPKRVQNPH
jgi:RND family efflux transporter MFP subunit